MRRVPHGGGIILSMAVTVPFWLAVAGCATAPRKPCEYTVHIRLTEDANGECHKLGMRGHDGVRLNDVDQVYGCGDSRGIISNGTRSNLGHENMHAIEDVCPEWVRW